MNENVTLREYVEERFRSLDKALGISSLDLERRLAELNKLRQDVVTDRSLYVTEELYQSTERERQIWRELTNARLTIIETRSVTWTTAIGVLFTLIQIGGMLIYWFAHKT